MASESYERRWGHSRTRRFMHEDKARRRIEAIERNQAWQSMTPEQKMIELMRRPGNCAKQRARVRKEIIAGGRVFGHPLEKA